MQSILFLNQQVLAETPPPRRSSTAYDRAILGVYVGVISLGFLVMFITSHATEYLPEFGFVTMVGLAATTKLVVDQKVKKSHENEKSKPTTRMRTFSLQDADLRTTHSPAAGLAQLELPMFSLARTW